MVVLSQQSWEESTTHLRPPSSLLPSSCACHNLFTIGACDTLASIYNNESLPRNYRRIFKKLESVRNGAPSFMMDPLTDLSRYLPQILTGFDFSNQSKAEFQERKMFDVEYLKRMTSAFSYIPCKIHPYSPNEIKTCLGKRGILAGRDLKLAFVGDSQVRNLIEQFVIYLRIALNLRAGDEIGMNLTTSFLSTRRKVDLAIQGEGLQMRLYWSSFLSSNRNDNVTFQGAKDLLEVWAQNKSTEKGEEVPDILYFDDGMWARTDGTEWEAITKVKHDFDIVYGYLKNISRTTRVILRTMTPVKDWAARHSIQNSGLDMMNQIGWYKFRDSDVWIWDTTTPVYLRERTDCWALWKTGFNSSLPRVWSCHDFQHPSKISETVAANMIWNYVCNDIMDLEDQFCCVS